MAGFIADDRRQPIEPDVFYARWLALYQCGGPEFKDVIADFKQIVPLYDECHGCEAGSLNPRHCAAAYNRFEATVFMCITASIYYHYIPLRKNP